MKRFVIIAFMGLVATLGVLAPVPCAAQPCNYRSKGVGDSGADQPGAIAVDVAGNVYVMGAFYGTINLGGAPLVSSGDRDVFPVKHAPDGTRLWSKRFGA